MKNLVPLMQREWLQHRFGWLMMVLVPLGLALALLSFGHIQIGDAKIERLGPGLPLAVAFFVMTAGMVTLLAIGWLASVIIASDVPRRDHADRSIEFWLSLPSTHAESFAAPLLVHLLLVPAAALLAGLAGGWVLSLVVVGRLSGVGAWLSLPWGDLALAVASLALRFAAALPLAALWLAPIMLTVMLMTALFRRWGWVVLAVGIGLGSQLLARVFGQPMLLDLIKGWLNGVARAFIAAEEGLNFGPDEHLPFRLAELPGFLLRDFGHALQNLASPQLAGGLVLAALCFALLVQWRRRAGARLG